MEKTQNLKSLAEDEWPREKLLKSGPSYMTDSELIAILLGSGSGSENVLELSRRILKEVNNNVSELARLSTDDLKKFKGVGNAKAVTLSAAFEISKRRRLKDNDKNLQIKSSKDSYNFIRGIIEDLNHEEFWVIYLNRINKVVDYYKLSQGGLSGTVIDNRLIIKRALDKFASNIIICHNHPSKSLYPSQGDIKVTEKLKNACEVFEINLLDHIIVTSDSYFSFCDEGKI